MKGCGILAADMALLRQNPRFEENEGGGLEKRANFSAVRAVNPGEARGGQGAVDLGAAFGAAGVGEGEGGAEVVAADGTGAGGGGVEGGGRHDTFFSPECRSARAVENGGLRLAP